VFYTEDIDRVLIEKNASLLLTLSGVNSDSGKTYTPATFPGVVKFPQDADLLFPVIAECRVIKSQAEIEVLRYVAKVSSDAHKKVMKIPFMKEKHFEYQAEVSSITLRASADIYITFLLYLSHFRQYFWRTLIMSVVADT
jgi:Xaa-Pro dipeptidase